MTHTIRLVHRFNDDVMAVERDGERITLRIADWKPVSFVARGPGVAEAVLALRGPGATFAELASTGGATLSDVSHYLERFAFGRLLCWDIAGPGVIGTISALASGVLPSLDGQAPGPVSLGRFSYLRRHGDAFVMDSAAVRARLTLAPGGLEAIGPLLTCAHPAPPGSLADALWRCGFLETGAESDARRSWEFHDLLMHESSRAVREDRPIGGTYRFKDVFPSPPAAMPLQEGAIALPVPDPATVRDESASLEALQGARRSIRSYAETPVSLEELATFLWRVARTLPGSNVHDMIRRPYPSGGCLHELEFHVAVRRCGGLAPGLYRYHGGAHALQPSDGGAPMAERMVMRAAASMGIPAAEPAPDMLVVVTSRLPRLAWKYEAIAYRISLLNAGVAIGTMYLVATDMDLAPSAVGTGDSRLFNRATGIDPFEETSIAEFALGRPSEGSMDQRSGQPVAA